MPSFGQSIQRVASLSPQFLRDFHLRFLRAFATLGFDDHEWFSGADLTWLIAHGNESLYELKAQHAAAVAAVANGETSGFDKPQIEDNLRSKAANFEKRVAELSEEVAKYEAELKLRD